MDDSELADILVRPAYLDEPELERVESVIMKNGLDEVDPDTDVFDVEEHMVVSMKLSGGISYYWERGMHAHMEVSNETRIYGTRGGIKLAYCTWDDPEIIYFDLDEEGKARETRYMEECPKEEDGYFLIRHLIDVLDGKAKPVLTLETAKKHMEIILKINEKNEGN